ncbi:MAG: HAD-IIIC family phosphatase [Terracidiphilus sp.]
MLIKELSVQPNLTPTRVAILGGSTTADVRGMLELFLLANGIRPEFYESGFNRYSEDILFENQELWKFKPDVIFIHTTWRNVSQFPRLMEPEGEVEELVRQEVARFVTLWQRIQSELGALIIQNNFDLPYLRPLGNLDATESYGRANYLLRLNAEFATYARRHPRFLINDIHYLSAQLGLDEWDGRTYWYNFRMAVSPTGTIAVAHSVASLVKSVYGKAKKCLVLDLDNTLWGGVVGDDGAQNLILGRDHAVGEAFLDFQRYVKELQCRGVILAVCSKNEIENAKEGLSHPDSILRIEDFSAFRANWNPKPGNIREIAAELNIGLDTIVFVDDNAAERALVADQLPEVAAPNVGSDVTRFAEILERERYFEVHTVVQDDLNRSAFYKLNAERSAYQSSFRDYGEFLASLDMTAEIAPFSPVYLERITQLINKTNQFNLTTRRYTSAEVDAISQDSAYVTLYGRLADKFGDNGLVSVLIGHAFNDTIEVDVWLMSCRVLNREMELAMFDALIEQCQARGIGKIVGIYIPSKKNGLVAEHYRNLGFSASGAGDGGVQRWYLDVPPSASQRSRHIRRTSEPLVAMTDSGFTPHADAVGAESKP